MHRIKQLLKTLCVCAIAFGWVLSLGANLAWAAPAQATVQWLTPEAEASDYRKATAPQPLKFPRDFGSHPEFQTEWWYYTGNLTTAEGRAFGYQFTIFRRAIAPQDVAPVQHEISDWRTRQLYLAHFTLSDIENKTFYPQERFSRGAAHLAGAEAEPYRVWLQDWTMQGEDGAVHLQAQGEKVAIDLTLQQTRPPVLQGDRGYSQKGPEPGNASYYYSVIQQPTEGSITVGDQSFEVTGISWTDHEYSTSALSPGTAGWDWFSLQFDDQCALMLYLLRQEDGSISPFSKGNFIDKQGQTQTLSAQDWQIDVLDHWTSPQSKATYPAAWKITIPKLELQLQGHPLMPNQELNFSTLYWEGAVNFAGQKGSKPISAIGYVELTGYQDSLNAMKQ